MNRWDDLDPDGQDRWVQTAVGILVAERGIPAHHDRWRWIEAYVLQFGGDVPFHVMQRIQREWARRAVAHKRAEIKRNAAHYAAIPTFGMWG